MSNVTVVGLGVGPEDLTLAHRQAIESADILVGGKRQLTSFAGLAEATWVLGANPTATLEEVKQYAAGKQVVILASGDPLFFGIGNKAMEVFGTENVVCMPNVTALQKAFARLKLPWNGMRSISVHGREPSDYFSELAHQGFVAIYTDPHNTPDRLAKLLLECGMANRKAAVVEEIGSADERLREMDLVGLAKKRFAPLNVMILYPLMEQVAKPRFGIEDRLFRKEKSLITKRETRAVVLAQLQVTPSDVMWDVGAGSGSVGIEAVRIAPGARVYAVERSQTRLAMIQENVRRLNGFGVKTVLGEAPEALQNLPDPDRVFVGGSGGKLVEIMEHVEARLRPGGRVVLSVVTPDSFGRAQRFIGRTRLASEWILLQVSRTVPIKSNSDRDQAALLTRFQPQTPMFLLSLWRGEYPESC